jgi:carboxypeptidase Q
MAAMRLTLLLYVPLYFFGAVFVAAQSPAPGASIAVSSETREGVRQIIGDSILNGKAYEYDGHLADMIGPRLTGSSNYMNAVEWSEQQFKALGLSNVHTEDWTMPATWEPNGPATGEIEMPVVHQLNIYSVGWSASTPKQGIEGEVVYVPSLLPAALDAQKAQLAGKIALVDSSSYGEKPTLYTVYSGFDRLYSFSSRALLVTGIANGAESVIATRMGGAISTMPVAEIGREDSLLIKRLLENGHVTVRFSAANTIRMNVKVPNVIAEIPGSEFPNEVVIVGAHLDSWHPGTGAQDNGTGAASVMEAARAIKALNRAPRRTIRFILFGGEEQGLIGSASYARQHISELPKIDAVLITDSGSEPAKGWYLMGREDEKGAVAALKPLLAGLGADGATSDTSFIFQTDHAAFDVLGVPTLVLWNSMDKYMTLHHKASDTFDSVIQKDLAQGAAVTAVTAYAIADSRDPFAAHLSPAEVQSMLQKANSVDEYNYLKSAGVLP